MRTLYTALHFSFRISESAARHDAGTRVSSRLRTGSLDRAGGMGGGGGELRMAAHPGRCCRIDRRSGGSTAC